MGTFPNLSLRGRVEAGKEGVRCYSEESGIQGHFLLDNKFKVSLDYLSKMDNTHQREIVVFHRFKCVSFCQVWNT